MQQAIAAKRRDPSEADAVRADAVTADAVITALLSGADSRVAIDPATGTNKYLCPPHPVPEVSCFSSCTASPIDPGGLARATDAFHTIMGAMSPSARAAALAAQARHISSRLLHHYGVAAEARATLHPSGTDALLAASLLIADEHPGRKLTAILPAASETGTGIGLAATCRLFDGPRSGAPLADNVIDAREIPLRCPAGKPRPADELDAAFRAAATSAAGRPILVLTHGTKTGLIAPLTPPTGIDVIVDACQARIAPATVASYLRRGWPVVVTGSKFFGGPAFSGAVLVPNGRLWQDPEISLGTALRWTAALDAIETFAPRQSKFTEILAGRSAALAREFAANPALVPVAGLQAAGPGWADLPSIFTFAVRDPTAPARLLTAAELQPLYRGLAKDGFLLGQPVSLGPFGGLRIAFGARDLTTEPGLPALFDAIRDITAKTPGGSASHA